MADGIHRNSLKPGHRLHWYRIERVLGQGGFGITYLAHDLNLEQQVAIKEYLPIELAVREQDHSVHPVSDTHGEKFKWGLDRFLAEAKTLAKFKHPNIVRVLAVFEDNHTGYMVMEYEHGESLQDLLARRKTLEEAELLKILLPILGGLEKVHERGFIHRDIKPANIFIREDGSPVLLDFGSARQALGAETKTLTSLVSPGYAPFEQYYSKGQEQGPWTDIYGLAATMYRAVTGKPPLDAVDRSKAILEASKDTFAGVAEIARGRYSERFLKAIDHALQFRQKDRPQTLAEWRREIGAESDTRPNVRALDAALATALAADESPAAAPPPAKSSPWRAALLAGLLAIGAGAAVWTYRQPGLIDSVVGPKLFGQKRADESAPTTPVGPDSSGQSRAAVEAAAQKERELAAQREKEAAQKKKADDVGALLAQAKADFEALRLTSPENDNALARYRKVLDLEAQNAEAQAGIRAVTDKFVSLAQHATAAGELTRAEEYLNEAAAISPDAQNIKLARDELNLRKAAQARAEAEEKSRQEKGQAVLKEVDLAAEKGDSLAVLTKLEQARTLGADAAAITAVREHLRSRLEALAAASAEESRQALNAGDPAKARAALKRTRDLKAQADALAVP